MASYDVHGFQPWLTCFPSWSRRWARCRHRGACERRTDGHGRLAGDPTRDVASGGWLDRAPLVGACVLNGRTAVMIGGTTGAAKADCRAGKLAAGAPSSCGK